jgi:hypothetical protein
MLPLPLLPSLAVAPLTLSLAVAPLTLSLSLAVAVAVAVAVAARDSPSSRSNTPSATASGTSSCTLKVSKTAPRSKAMTSVKKDMPRVWLWQWRQVAVDSTQSGSDDTVAVAGWQWMGGSGEMKKKWAESERY